MPLPDSAHWGHIFEGVFRSTPSTPVGVTFYNSDAGFSLNFGQPHGKGFDWYKIVCDKEQVSREGNYKVEVVLLTAACDPPMTPWSRRTASQATASSSPRRSILSPSRSSNPSSMIPVVSKQVRVPIFIPCWSCKPVPAIPWRSDLEVIGGTTRSW